MYAILIEIDGDSLSLHLGENESSASRQIGSILRQRGFVRQQGGLYLGDGSVDAVTCVMAASELARSLPWFSSAVRSIRMLRIDEISDLMPAVELPMNRKSKACDQSLN